MRVYTAESKEGLAYAGYYEVFAKKALAEAKGGILKVWENGKVGEHKSYKYTLLGYKKI